MTMPPRDRGGATPRRKAQGSSPPATTVVVVMSGGPYSYEPDFESGATGSHYDAVVAEGCLPVGSYGFTMYDVGGDGICCDYGRGEYGMGFAGGRVVRPLSRGDFAGASEGTPFEVTADDIDVFFPGGGHPGGEEGEIAPIVTTDGVDVYPAPPPAATPVGGGVVAEDDPAGAASNSPLVDAGGSVDDSEVPAAATNVSVIIACSFPPPPLFSSSSVVSSAFVPLRFFLLEPGHYRRFDQQLRDGVGYRRHGWSREVLRSPLRR